MAFGLAAVVRWEVHCGARLIAAPPLLFAALIAAIKACAKP
jgi:hypothetical protein